MGKWSEELKEKTRTELFSSAVVKMKNIIIWHSNQN